MRRASWFPSFSFSFSSFHLAKGIGKMNARVILDIWKNRELLLMKLLKKRIWNLKLDFWNEIYYTILLYINWMMKHKFYKILYILGIVINFKILEIGMILKISFYKCILISRKVFFKVNSISNWINFINHRRANSIDRIAWNDSRYWIS